MGADEEKKKSVSRQAARLRIGYGEAGKERKGGNKWSKMRDLQGLSCPSYLIRRMGQMGRMLCAVVCKGGR